MADVREMERERLEKVRAFVEAVQREGGVANVTRAVIGNDENGDEIMQDQSAQGFDVNDNEPYRLAKLLVACQYKKVTNIRTPCAYFATLFACEAIYGDDGQARTVLFHLRCQWLAPGLRIGEVGHKRFYLDRVLLDNPNGVVTPPQLNLRAGSNVIQMLELMVGCSSGTSYERQLHNTDRLTECIESLIGAYYNITTVDTVTLYMKIIAVGCKSFLFHFLRLCHGVVDVRGQHEVPHPTRDIYEFVCMLHTTQHATPLQLTLDNTFRQHSTVRIVPITPALYGTLANDDYEDAQDGSATPIRMTSLWRAKRALDRLNSILDVIQPK